jgi:hypothetical protein
MCLTHNNNVVEKCQRYLLVPAVVPHVARVDDDIDAAAKKMLDHFGVIHGVGV